MRDPMFSFSLRKPKIGLTPCLFHRDPERPLFKDKALYYYESMMIAWIQELGVSPVLLPPAGTVAGASLEEICADLDGVVFQGGVDVAPESYGEEPLRPEWCGDRFRDSYELAIAAICDQRGIPMLGICRGAQLLAVHVGGTLYQDITVQISGAFEHRNWEKYEDNCHEVEIVAGSVFDDIYSGTRRGWINSIHHQSVKQIPTVGYQVGARCPIDGVVEGFSRTGPGSWLLAVQWHPEFQRQGLDHHLLGRDPILIHFAQAVERFMLDGQVQ